MADSKFEVLMLVGGSAADRAEFCRKALDPSFQFDSFAALGDSAAKEMFANCLREKRSCVLDGEFALSADRAVFIGQARNVGARVVAFDFSQVDVPADRSKLPKEERHKLHLRMRENDCNVTLEEGFDEINRVKRIAGLLKFTLFEKRVPMSEFVKDEKGNTVEVKLGSEYYMIERPGGMGCLMSDAAFKRLQKPIPQ